MPRVDGVGLLDDHGPLTREDHQSVPKRYPAEFRRKVLDLVAAGRPVAQVAADLAISEQTIYVWRRQHLIDTGQLPGHHQRRERRADRGPPADRRARGRSRDPSPGGASCSARWCPQKTVRGDRRDGPQSCRFSWPAGCSASSESGYYDWRSRPPLGRGRCATSG